MWHGLKFGQLLWTFLYFYNVYNAKKAPPFITSIKNTRNDLINNITTNEKRKAQKVINLFSGNTL